MRSRGKRPRSMIRATIYRVACPAARKSRNSGGSVQRRRDQSSCLVGRAARRAGPASILALVVAAVSLAAGPHPARAQGDFQQRRPDPPDAGAAKPAPVLTRAPRVKTAPAPAYPPAALAL